MVRRIFRPLRKKVISLIIPCYHKDYHRIEKILPKIISKAAQYLIGEVIFVSNGPRTINLQDKFPLNSSILFRHEHTNSIGLGAAYKEGIKQATYSIICLSASDLPFGFSDVAAYLCCKDQSHASIFIGSKRHPKSIIFNRSIFRDVMSCSFYVLRKLFLNLKTPRDSQGTIIFTKTSLHADPTSIGDDNYFYSCALLSWEVFYGGSFEELPIQATLTQDNPSHMNIISTSLSMFWNLIRLRGRMIKLSGQKKKHTRRCAF
jgi:hypothetical protein